MAPATRTGKIGRDQTERDPKASLLRDAMTASDGKEHLPIRMDPLLTGMQDS